MARGPIRLLVAVTVFALVVAGCGDDDEPSADPTTTEAPTTTSTEAPTTTDTTGGDDGACPDEAPVPAGATDVQEAALDYDGDGDGDADTLSVFRHDAAWWVQVAWSSGGSAAVTIDEAGDLGARPVGGYDIDGTGVDEAFVSIGGPASGVIVGVYRTDGCSLVPVLDEASGMPFTFPVTASTGTFSGATCEGLGDLDLYTGELVDVDEGEYLVAQSPYRLVDGQMVVGPGDAGSVGFDEVHEFSTLGCGVLSSGL